MTALVAPLTIGKVADLADVGVETIRFYEREKLIDDPPRSAVGYRHYPPETVERVLFIRRAKELGFTLKEIKELLCLRVDPGKDCRSMKLRAQVKIANIEGKIAELKKMKNALVTLSSTCQADLAMSECPILDFLGSEKPGGG